MTEMALKDVAKALKHIDFVMLNSHADSGVITGRPMSNNRDVEFDGDSWFFADENSSVYREVQTDPRVTLSAQGDKGLLGKPPLFLSIEGRAELIHDKALIEAHWIPELKRWWPDGPHSAGIVLIKVHAERITYWDGDSEGDVKLPN